MDKNLIRSLAVGTAAVLVALGAWTLGKSSATGSSTPAQQVGAQAPPQAGAQGRRVPQGPPGGFGSPVTGAAAAKAGKAALARYPGRVEVVVQLPDGSYVVHVITSTREVHVAVSEDFEVTGT